MRAKISNGSLRIIGGRWRSRTLQFPAVEQLRPTANRIRETLFNWLREDIEDEICLDLFAGSGACGLEALSRGAQQVTFVEQNPEVAAAIRSNLARLGAAEMPVVCADALAWITNTDHASEPGAGIVFIDPPFALDLEQETCAGLEKSGLLKDRALIYVESDKILDSSLFPGNWRTLKTKKAGSVYYYLMERQLPE